MAKKTGLKPGKIVKNLIYVLTLLFIVIFLYYKRESLYRLSSIQYHEIIILLLLSVTSLLLNSLLFKNNTSIFDVRLSFVEWFGLSVSNQMYNYIIPGRGGMILRGIYLKKRHNLTYNNYLSLTAGTYLFSLVFTSLLASILGTILYISGVLSNLSIVFISFSVFFIVVFLILFLWNTSYIKLNNFIGRKLNKVLEGIKTFKRYPYRIKNIIFIQIFQILIRAFRLFFIFFILGIQVDYLTLLFILSLVSFLRVFSITPGNIGIKEGVIGLFSSFLNVSSEEAVFAALLDRIFVMMVVFAAGLFFSRILIKKIDD